MAHLHDLAPMAMTFDARASWLGVHFARAPNLGSRDMAHHNYGANLAQELNCNVSCAMTFSGLFWMTGERAAITTCAMQKSLLIEIKCRKFHLTITSLDFISRLLLIINNLDHNCVFLIYFHVRL